MADVTPEVSTSPDTGGTNAAENDPFLRLHKMSTTAGLGSGDYVAINGSAIAALLLGIASALVLFNSYLLLLLPLAGIVCGVLAFRQITSSNGTQTGRILAGIGLLLSIGFGGFFIGKEAIETTTNKHDEREVVAVIEQFGDLIKNDKYAEAYNLLDDRFKDRLPESVFTERWKANSASPIVGHIAGMTWNGHLGFETDAVSDQRVASGIILISFDKLTAKDRQSMLFRKANGKWQIDQIPQVFPAEQAAQEPRAAPAQVRRRQGPRDHLRPRDHQRPQGNTISLTSFAPADRVVKLTLPDELNLKSRLARHAFPSSSSKAPHKSDNL